MKRLKDPSIELLLYKLSGQPGHQIVPLYWSGHSEVRERQLQNGQVAKNGLLGDVTSYPVQLDRREQCRVNPHSMGENKKMREKKLQAIKE